MPHTTNSARGPLVAAAVLLGLIAVGLLGRVLPHAPNMTPVAAIALFAGAHFRRPLLAAVAPLVVMALSDAWWLGRYDWRVMLVVYAAMLFPVVMRRLVAGRYQPVRVAACAASSSLLFFLLTNFAVWQWTGNYAPTVAGLLHCYAVALPLLKYTLAGDLLWSGALFGLYAAVKHFASAARPAWAQPSVTAA